MINRTFLFFCIFFVFLILSMQDKENELLHQLPLGGIFIVQAITFCCDGAQLLDNIHHLCGIVEAHSRDILTCCPWSPESQPSSHLIFPIPVWTIICRHHILEEREELRNERMKISRLWIFVKIFHNFVCL